MTRYRIITIVDAENIRDVLAKAECENAEIVSVVTINHRQVAGSGLQQSEQFSSALKELHKRGGKPSFRRIADLTENAGDRVGHVTVADLLNNVRLTSWPITEKIITALDGDVDKFRTLWIESTEIS